MLSEGENIGWVQNMLGHGSMQMIFTKYYARIPNKTRNDGSAVMKTYNAEDMIRGNQGKKNRKI